LNYLLVFIGGGLGSLLRYEISRQLPTPTGGFPWATLLANLLACLVLGLGLAAVAKSSLPPQHRLLLLTGFCGGFSTFSTFSAEVVALWSDGHAGMALLYAAISLLTGCGVLLLGLRMI